MKKTFSSPLAIAALGFALGCMAALADPADKGLAPTNPGDHGTSVTSGSRPSATTRTPTLHSTYNASASKPSATIRGSAAPSPARGEESGFTTGVGTNPADHGINNSTATHPGDNGLSTGVGSSNDIKGSSTAAPTVNSADLNSKAGKGIRADTEKK
ncbi:MAG: hypothetical protein JWO94_2321 [Verrucomicrobiaceae bacterium]|nr:hypothetical protein [Verrucomicrobiaceae bacterium]